MSEDLTPLKISPNVLADIYREARSAFPYECCGWLSGPKDGGEVTVVRACENAQALGTHPTEAQRGAETAYVITGKDLLSLNHTLESDTRIQVFDLEGQFLREWGSERQGDGEFSAPGGIAVDGEGNVYVTDMADHRIQVFDLEGRSLREWGEYGDGDGEFDNPVGIAVGGEGNVYITDTGNHRIQVFDLEGQFLREWGSEGEGDGEFDGPSGIALDGEGNVYVADSENYPAKVIFHSHPNGRAYLSPTDREVATSPWGDGPAYPVQQLVVGIDGDRVVEAALFAWSDDEGGFVQIDRFDGADV